MRYPGPCRHKPCHRWPRSRQELCVRHDDLSERSVFGVFRQRCRRAHATQSGAGHVETPASRKREVLRTAPPQRGAPRAPFRHHLGCVLIHLPKLTVREGSLTPTFSRWPLWRWLRRRDTNWYQSQMAREATNWEPVKEDMVDLAGYFDVSVADLDPAAGDAVLAPKSKRCMSRRFGVGHGVFYHGRR